MNLVKAFTIAAVFGAASLSAQVGLAATVKVRPQTNDVFTSSGALGPIMGALEIKYTDPTRWTGDKYTGPKSGSMAGALQLKTEMPGAKGLSSLLAFCINPFVRLNMAVDTYEAVSDLPGMGTILTSKQLGLLGGLAHGAWAKITDTTSAVAFQFAVWEIVTETDDTLGLSNGKFRLFYSGALKPATQTHAAEAMANSWLASLGQPDFRLGTKGLTIFHNADTVRKDGKGAKATQDLMTYAEPAPVPLPGAFGLLALGLGALFAKGRRKLPA